MAAAPYNITVAELARRGRGDIPDHFVPACHLIYSSPATLAYNSPGALGFGVKRATLVIPESVMLLVSPDACARNSTVLSTEEGYADRLFYLLMSESDLVTGNHLSKIPEAIEEILSACDPVPKVVVVCITCVDALMGTDLERVCRAAQERCGVDVVPSYMYALEREGRRPPMSAIRTTIYSLVERLDVRPDTVNLMGFFTPLDPRGELFALLRAAGIRHVNQVSAMRTLEEYRGLGAANFNLVLDPEARPAAEDLRQRLGMPYVELARLYDPERIHRQYQLFASGVGIGLDDGAYLDEARRTCESFSERYWGASVAVGEMCNADPFELACALVSLGLVVPAVFSNVTEGQHPHIRRLAAASPQTRVYAGISPTMVNYASDEGADASIGKDAGAYCPGSANVAWNSEAQPFGYRGLVDLLDQLSVALEGGAR
ncbi:MAG: nitrogenase component 1 [Atopobiaceae bacterium]|jgi:nitrogenase molybdenum-cofactor synthesis protein NifE|nr:nitrogenase component 1 [Atopobiaceae bacterium]